LEVVFETLWSYWMGVAGYGCESSDQVEKKGWKGQQREKGSESVCWQSAIGA
jgi:hypothetical protein